MLKVELKEIIVEFDTEETNITNEEKINLSVSLSHLEMRELPLSLKDKPRTRQMINDEIDRLNKAGYLSNTLAQNITYTFKGQEFNYVVETRTTLSKIDTISATSEKEALEKIERLEDTKLYLSDLKKSNDFSGVKFIVINQE